MRRIHLSEIEKRRLGYPLAIDGGSVCDTCGFDTLLVRSMKGGFVTRNCPCCYRKQRLSREMFFSIASATAGCCCPLCGCQLEPGYIDNNYVMMCIRCQKYLFLGDMIPPYYELESFILQIS